MITFDNVKITKTKVRDGEYSDKKKKWVKHKSPKVTKKVIYDENCYDLGELYSAVKFACEQSVYDGELSVTMTVKNEY